MNKLMRFEHRSQQVASPRVFLRRLGKNVAVAAGVLGASLAIGIAGYMLFEGKDIVAAYDNAAMILSGMGPFDIASTTGGRIFEGTYALYSGLTVIVVASLILAPVFHRVLHSFHVEDEDDEKRDEKQTKGPSRRRA